MHLGRILIDMAISHLMSVATIKRICTSVLMVCIMAKECKSGEYLGSDYRGENLVSDAETGDDNIYGEAV